MRSSKKTSVILLRAKARAAEDKPLPYYQQPHMRTCTRCNLELAVDPSCDTCYICDTVLA